jgi:hypothetical protein
VPLKRSINAGFREGVFEKISGRNAYVKSEALTVGG